ncbi:hypothetical protein T02_9064, partial [Trichinella nativa]
LFSLLLSNITGNDVVQFVLFYQNFEVFVVVEQRSILSWLAVLFFLFHCYWHQSRLFTNWFRNFSQQTLHLNVPMAFCVDLFVLFVSLPASQLGT